MRSERVAEVLEHLAANIRRHRARAGLTQEQLSEAANIDMSYVQRVERAQVNATVSTLVALADALGVKVGMLFRQAKLAATKRGRPPKTKKKTAKGLVSPRKSR